MVTIQQFRSRGGKKIYTEAPQRRKIGEVCCSKTNLRPKRTSNLRHAQPFVRSSCGLKQMLQGQVLSPGTRPPERAHFIPFIYQAFY